MTDNNQIEIYKLTEGEVIFNVDTEEETIWATQNQIADLFGATQQNIAHHLKSIYEDGELDEKRTAKKSFVVRQEGTRQVRREVNLYNLDAIISVGYRVNSKKATDFRIWATSVLHNYLTKGVAINERRLKSLDSKRLKDVEDMMGVVRRLITRQALDAGEANGVLEVISRYSTSFKTLEEYDNGFIDLSGLNTKKSSPPSFASMSSLALRGPFTAPTSLVNPEATPSEVPSRIFTRVTTAKTSTRPSPKRLPTSSTLLSKTTPFTMATSVSALYFLSSFSRLTITILP